MFDESPPRRKNRNNCDKSRLIIHTSRKASTSGEIVGNPEWRPKVRMVGTDSEENPDEVRAPPPFVLALG